MAKIDLTITNSRPDLKVVYRPSGAFLIKDGKLIPDMNDSAMKAKADLDNKPILTKEEKKEDTKS